MYQFARPDSRACFAFISWWTGGEESEGFTAVRKAFLLREALFGLREVDPSTVPSISGNSNSGSGNGDADDDDAVIMMSDESHSIPAKGDADYYGSRIALAKELNDSMDIEPRMLRRVTRYSALRMCEQENYLSATEVAELRALGEAYDPTSASLYTSAELDTFARHALFRKYRSWLKGGNVVEAKQKEIERDRAAARAARIAAMK